MSLALFSLFFLLRLSSPCQPGEGFLAPFSVLLSVAGSSKRTDLLEDTIFVH